jgi:hypothetical protein
MATQSETHTNINMLIHMMQARGARRHLTEGTIRLTWHRQRNRLLAGMGRPNHRRRECDRTLGGD